MQDSGKRRGSLRAWRLRTRTDLRGPLSLALVALAVVAAPVCAPRAAEQTNAASEYQIKAAFLFHFAQFVDWPAEAFKEADSPINYCTVGEDPFRGALDAALNGKMLGARPFRVKHLKRVEEAEGCHLVFLGADERKALAADLASLAGSATLTVGEAEHFAADGGMIGFCLDDNKVRFEINVHAAERARLKISARLLALAKTVIGEQKGT